MWQGVAEGTDRGRNGQRCLNNSILILMQLLFCDTASKWDLNVFLTACLAGVGRFSTVASSFFSTPLSLLGLDSDDEHTQVVNLDSSW